MANGIRISGSKNKATQRVFSALVSFTFEQQCGELLHWSEADKKVLEEAKSVLSKHL